MDIPGVEKYGILCGWVGAHITNGHTGGREIWYSVWRGGGTYN